MITQSISLRNVAAVVAGPRLLRGHRHFKQAYATQLGTNCTRYSNVPYAFINLQTLGAVCHERGTMCLAQDHPVL